MSGYLKYGSKGDKVRHLQRLLNDNAYFRPRHRLVVDGQIGPRTCSVIQQTKYRMGYQKGSITPVAGATLFAYLEKKRPLPSVYRARREARLAAIEKAKHVESAQTKMRLHALAIIKGELGTMENPPHSNHIKYTTWWGWGNVAYCVIGISWSWVKAGSKAFVRGARWAGTDLFLADAKYGRNGIHLTNDPDPGCPGVIDFNGHSDPDHGITFVKDNGNGTATTYEFNTSSGWMEGVLKQDRPLRNCWWFEVER